MKFLVDECLSPELVKLAREYGHGESSHVVWMGLGGRKDWELKQVILDDDWTFVTLNSVDFRGPRSRPGTSGQYAGVELHAGLICLEGANGLDLDDQLELFEQALHVLVDNPDLVNQVLEVSLLGDDQVRIVRYEMPNS
jgi:hypothetical protein